MSIISDSLPLIECDLIFRPRCNIPWDVHTVYLNWNLLMPRHPGTNISQIYCLFSKQTEIYIMQSSPMASTPKLPISQYRMHDFHGRSRNLFTMQPISNLGTEYFQQLSCHQASKKLPHLLMNSFWTRGKEAGQGSMRDMRQLSRSFMPDSWLISSQKAMKKLGRMAIEKEQKLNKNCQFKLTCSHCSSPIIATKENSTLVKIEVNCCVCVGELVCVAVVGCDAERVDVGVGLVVETTKI